MYNDHRNNGRFVPGNPGGPGRPKGCKQAEFLRRTLLDGVTAEQVQSVMSKLYELAMEGDVSAARCFLDHSAGRPVQAVELSAPDSPGLDPLDVVKAIMDALAPLPNYDEIQRRLGQALRRLEKAQEEGPARLESSDNHLN